MIKDYSNCAIVVSSCDKFQDLWKPFFTLFFRYWPDCPFPVYLISNYFTYPDERVKTIVVGNDRGWAVNTKSAFKKIPAKYIIYFHEDFLLKSPVDNSHLLFLLDIIKQEQAVCLRLFSCPGSDLPYKNYADIGEISKDASYRVSLQTAVWDKDIFSGLIKNGENAWEMEINGTKRSKTVKRSFLSLKEGLMNKPLDYICTAVVKGKWTSEALEFCEKEGLEIDLTQHPKWSRLSVLLEKWRPFLKFLAIPGPRKLKRYLYNRISNNYLKLFFFVIISNLIALYKWLVGEIKFLKDYSGIIRDFFDYYRKLKSRENMEFMIMTGEKTAISGFDHHYIYQDLWAFERILEAKPNEHIDVGSKIDFVSLLTAATKVISVEIRPLVADFKNFESIKGDILRLPFADNSIYSLSSLHVVEHIGLGRYGDSLDAEGSKRACRELARALAPGGRLYFSLPIGKPKTVFNAHRIHSPQQIIDYFSDLKLLEFSVVDDWAHWQEKVDWREYADSNYACGLFLFTK